MDRGPRDQSKCNLDSMPRNIQSIELKTKGDLCIRNLWPSEHIYFGEDPSFSKSASVRCEALAEKHIFEKVSLTGIFPPLVVCSRSLKDRSE